MTIAPQRAQLADHGQGGGVADVVGVGFERGAQDGDLDAGQVRAGRPVRAVQELGGELHDALAASLVDQVDLVQEPQRLADPQLLGAGLERPDVLGQAAAAEPDAGPQELVADPGVVADRPGEHG